MNQVRLRRQVGSPLPTTFGLLVAGMPDPQPCTRLGFRSQCGSIEALFDWLVEMAAQGVQKMLVSVGESLIDLVQQGQDESGKPLFCAHEGGSPFNVAIAMARLGASVGFLCPSSTDAFGIQNCGLGWPKRGSPLCSRPVAAPTALAVVSTDATGHPSYAFHRQGTADRTLDPIRLCEALPESLEALHFGSMVLSQASDWPAWRAVIRQAREQGIPIAFDPNIRPSLIDNLSSYEGRLQEALALADCVKVSDEDLSLLYSEQSADWVVQNWLKTYPLRLVILTRGSQGAQAWSGDETAQCPAPTLSEPVVDTVGAGDTFQGAFVSWLARNGRLRGPLSQSELLAMLEFATVAASLNCLNAGCQPPKRQQVEEALR